MKSANDVSIPARRQDVQAAATALERWQIPPHSGLTAEIGDAVEEATAYTMNDFGGERTLDEKIQRTQSSLLRQF